MQKLRGLYVLDRDAFGRVYGPDERAAIGRLLTIAMPPMTRADVAADPRCLADVDVLISGWGAPRLDDAFLASAPSLGAFFYGAGSLAGVLTPAVWRRGLVVSTALAANAVPVAEYALATILFSMKHGWQLAGRARAARCFPARDGAPGNFGSTVGLISMGAIARKLVELLRPFDLNVIVYDPFLGDVEAAALGVTRVALDECFERAHVVSLHAPDLAETRGMVTGALLDSIRPGGTFINTARPAVVRQDELIAVARRRPDLHFVLDVAEPEPPSPDSPLYTLANVTLTPHIAGSVGAECRRMGRYVVEELERYASGRPLAGTVTPESIRFSSHRPPAVARTAVSSATRSPERITSPAGEVSLA